MFLCPGRGRKGFAAVGDLNESGGTVGSGSAGAMTDYALNAWINGSLSQSNGVWQANDGAGGLKAQPNAKRTLATIPDFTLAVPEAKFGYTEVKVGFVPAIAASFLLRQVGELRTRELLLSGKLIKAHEALEMGLVTQIVNADELMGTAHALAQSLLQNSPQAMQEVKRLLSQHASRRLDEELEDAIEVNAQQKSAEDFREGVEAFLGRRKPEWPSLNLKV